MSTLRTSLAEYLSMSYHPDRDYVDGEVQERNLGEFDHAAVQAFSPAGSSNIVKIGRSMFCQKFA